MGKDRRSTDGEKRIRRAPKRTTKCSWCGEELYEGRCEYCEQLAHDMMEDLRK